MMDRSTTNFVHEGRAFMVSVDQRDYRERGTNGKAFVWDCNDSNIWIDSRKRIVCCFDLAFGDGIKESGFSDVWESHNPDCLF